MLNKLFESHGFQTSLRISAAFNAGILCIGILLARTRFPPAPRDDGNLFKSMKVFFREPEYVAVVLGYVCLSANFRRLMS